MILPNKNDAIHKAWLFRLLKKVADDTFLVSVLRFKGGTCAAMRGFLDRFSIDLDFDFIGKEKQIVESQKHLELIFKDLDLEIKDKSQKVPQYFLKYPDPDFNRNNLKIDTFFPPLEGSQYEAVRLIDVDRIFYCQTIETMFASKLIALIDRFRKGRKIASRDLYDVHYFFLKAYNYDNYLIEKYSGKKTVVFLQELSDFIDQEISQKNIDQDLNFLLPLDKFSKIRKNLKPETLMFLKDEIKRLNYSS